MTGLVVIVDIIDGFDLSCVAIAIVVDESLSKVTFVATDDVREDIRAKRMRGWKRPTDICSRVRLGHRILKYANRWFAVVLAE